ncbi:FG-GAP repeat domain-containing protein [Paenibacillus cymbidii]|uniref:FG-GAP repeat domain-containing protein n=1 Tax=Paenibacillus cymbidii TaxID=1639034 RepID=UPI00108106D5|nr:VCBS repeat-containing protein [Paenibacillus cymbidii]
MTTTWKPAAYGEKIPIRTPHGPISFGLTMAGAIIPGTGGQGKRLLLSRIWEGIFDYATEELLDGELQGEPTLAFEAKSKEQLFGLADWNHDGREDAVVSERYGFLHLLERRPDDARVAFDYAGVIVDRDSGLPFNLPYDNPNYLTDALAGYTDPYFYNYAYPIAYPNRHRRATDLIVGDMAGNLWWMPDVSTAGERPAYVGVEYEKPAQAASEYGRRLREQYGTRYVRPAGKIADESGVPFLLGVGFENGKRFAGGNVRPVVYRNKRTGSDDLLVLTGYMELKAYYLQRVNDGEDGQPAFRNLGEVALHGVRHLHPFSFHDKLIVDPERDDELLLTSGNHIARMTNTRPDGIVPEFSCSGLISADNAITCDYHYTEVLEDRQCGKRYLLNAGFRDWTVREIVGTANGIMLASGSAPLLDQNGPFHVDGETDPQVSPECGCHHASRWDFDGSGRQHLIVGTDMGHLYLLVDEGEVGKDGQFRYRSEGPLRDSGGHIIRIHNRLSPIGIDLDGDGREDLLVGGATYQRGFETDPAPGAGIYYLLHKGIDAAGLPILEPHAPVPFAGEPCPVVTNRMVELQLADLDEDGEREIVIWSVADRFSRVYKLVREKGEGGFALALIGTLPDMTLLKRLHDLDGDGKPEMVYGGGEPGVAYYQRML